MNHLKTNPVGIDKHINKMQEKIYTGLGYSDFYGFGRVYTTVKDGRRIPEFFVGGIDYKDVLTNDSLNGHFFFVERPTSNKIGIQLEGTLDIVFMLDLKKLKPGVQHRADEEVRLDIMRVLDKIRYYNLEETVKGIDALNGFDTELIDMQPYHFLRFTGKLKYQINC